MAVSFGGPIWWSVFVGPILLLLFMCIPKYNQCSIFRKYKILIYVEVSFS
jgi:hypothetical protein